MQLTGTLFSCFLFLFPVIFSGCKKDPTVITFEMPYSNYVSVPKSSTLYFPVTMAGNMATNALEQYAYHRTTTEKVRSVKLKYMRYTLVSPIGPDFSFLKSVHVRVTRDNWPEVEAAYLDPISDSIGIIMNMSIPDTDMKEYVKADSMYMKAVITLDKPNNTVLQVKSELMFEVEAETID